MSPAARLARSSSLRLLAETELGAVQERLLEVVAADLVQLERRSGVGGFEPGGERSWSWARRSFGSAIGRVADQQVPEAVGVLAEVSTIPQDG